MTSQPPNPGLLLEKGDYGAIGLSDPAFLGGYNIKSKAHVNASISSDISELNTF